MQSICQCGLYILGFFHWNLPFFNLYRINPFLDFVLLSLTAIDFFFISMFLQSHVLVVLSNKFEINFVPRANRKDQLL